MESTLGTIAILLNVFLDTPTMSQALGSRDKTVACRLENDSGGHPCPTSNPNDLPTPVAITTICLYWCLLIHMLDAHASVFLAVYILQQWTGVKMGRVGYPFGFSCLLFQSFSGLLMSHFLLWSLSQLNFPKLYYLFNG